MPSFNLSMNCSTAMDSNGGSSTSRIAPRRISSMWCFLIALLNQCSGSSFLTNKLELKEKIINKLTDLQIMIEALNVEEVDMSQLESTVSLLTTPVKLLAESSQSSADSSQSEADPSQSEADPSQSEAESDPSYAPFVQRKAMFEKKRTATAPPPQQEETPWFLSGIWSVYSYKKMINALTDIIMALDLDPGFRAGLINIMPKAEGQKMSDDPARYIAQVEMLKKRILAEKEKRNS